MKSLSLSRTVSNAMLSVHLLLFVAWEAQAAEAAQVVFVTGQVYQGKRALATGDRIQEGDNLQTGTDGYVYLKTVDKGFLILRPNSQASIVRYHIDPNTPDNTRIKLELLQGVARHISGEAVKAARQNFRFNTPVAAIGVRGTDFTVMTTLENTQVSVSSGGIVVSGFSTQCSPGGHGPCEGQNSRELFADQKNQMLQIQRGQELPSLTTRPLAPPSSTLPHPEEPHGKNSGNITLPPSAGEPNLLLIRSDLNELATIAVSTASTKSPTGDTPTIVSPAVTEPEIIWGRWRTVMKQGSNLDLGTLQQNYDIMAINNVFALLRTQQGSNSWQAPTQGNASFSFSQGDALILNEKNQQMMSASIGNARLDVDFATARFTTSFSLANNRGEQWGLYAQGTVTRDGTLSGDPQFPKQSNMTVQGGLNSSVAAYLFQARLDEQRVVSGATSWKK